ncbi:MAG: hypothetical protein IPM79_24460 [Polyangiaceae bacterium]|nr:hypothetical protein [Polyangiaceae bacterium]MBK8940681.1 hypothetical protein [Polyangiaceae bacterium]
MAGPSLLSKWRRKRDGASPEGSLTLERFRRASLLTRTLVTIASLLALFTVAVGALGFAAVAATKAAFPPAGEQPLASPSGAGEAEGVAPTPKRRAKGEPSE